MHLCVPTGYYYNIADDKFLLGSISNCHEYKNGSVSTICKTCLPAHTGTGTPGEFSACACDTAAGYMVATGKTYSCCKKGFYFNTERMRCEKIFDKNCEKSLNGYHCETCKTDYTKGGNIYAAFSLTVHQSVHLIQGMHDYKVVRLC